MSKDLIVKDNRLINAKFSLTKTQARFIAYLASLIDKNDKDKDYKIDLNTILQALNIERNNLTYLRNNLRELLQKVIIIQDDDTAIIETTFLSYFKIDKKNDILECSFHNTIKPYLLHLQENFTKLSLKKIMSFDSSFTIRMYEIIQERVSKAEKYSNKNILTFEIDLQELKEILVGNYNIKTGLIEIKKSYEFFNRFKEKVLDKAKEELKEKGEYYFNYKPLKKKGKKVISLEISILKNKDKIIQDFKDNKKKQLLYTNKEKEIAKEQIRRIMLRTNNIRDKLKLEQFLYRKYLSGELEYDKDLLEIINQIETNQLKLNLKR